ncbi:hypothetical protein HIM_10558 [Hirsutella minnesotensis 3608]|uniref:CN hydrolase domain-containing protein n=1 Tax=Hirsutella minnesotensis 3608 TaxID=1043627 RepID=A0A0F8A258_9HYPO|nr:hypothetical protein HIM_10558 [Hirsutella minnesotensis 3608]
MKQAMGSRRPRWTCRKVRGMGPKAVGALFGDRAAVTGVLRLSAAFASCLSVASMPCVVVPAVFTLLRRVRSFDVSGYSAGAKKAPWSFCRFQEGDDECLIGKLFIVTARDSDADRRVSRLIVYFVTDGSVIVYFVSVQVCKLSRAVVYDVIVPFLAGLNGRCAKVIGPFGLAFYKQIAGVFVCGANGPAGVHLEDLRDPIEFKARLAGYVSSYGVADVVSGRCTVGVGKGLFPESEEASGEVLGEVAFRPGSKFLGGLVEMCTEGSENPDTGYNFKSLQEITPFLEPSGSGITALWARTTALKYNCVVTVGYPEKVDVSPKWPTGPEYYNAVIVVNGDGETIVNYRKSFLYYTDETWALEGGRGFYGGFIPGLGNTSIGICMDINPYKFEAPWHAFEFAFHILEIESNLVIVSMAWLTWEDRRLFTRSPNEPDMETLTYWVTRLEPIIRSENQDEIIVVFCNRIGYEGDVTYAGTSAVVGIQDGEVKVYGLLGRGEKELLVVDTNDTPYAKLVYQSDQRSGVQLKEHAESSCLAGGSTGTSGSAGPNAMVISESDQVKQQCGNIDSNSSTPPNKGEHGRQQCKSENAVTTSASPMSEQSHRHSKTSFSSSQALEQRTSSAKTHQSSRVKIPDRLNLANQNYSVKSPETDSTLVPTPSAPSPTPMAIRPRLQIPESSFGPPQSYIVENPCSAASQKSSHSLQSIKSDDSEASTVVEAWCAVQMLGAGRGWIWRWTLLIIGAKWYLGVGIRVGGKGGA